MADESVRDESSPPVVPRIELIPNSGMSDETKVTKLRFPLGAVLTPTYNPT